MCNDPYGECIYFLFFNARLITAVKRVHRYNNKSEFHLDIFLH